MKEEKERIDALKDALKEMDKQPLEIMEHEKDPLKDLNVTVPAGYIFEMKTEVEYLRYERSIGRPIRLPQEPTAQEYNFLVDYLKKTRAGVLKLKGIKDIKEVPAEKIHPALTDEFERECKNETKATEKTEG